MRRFYQIFCIFAVCSIILCCPVSAFAAIECNQSASYDTNTSGSTKIVSGASKTVIYICGYTIVSGGTANVSLKSGTGTNCGTGTAAVTPAYSMVAQNRVSDDSPVWRGLLVPTGQDLCINSSAGVAIQAIVYYTAR
jgi:hypothetical protein